MPAFRKSSPIVIDTKQHFPLIHHFAVDGEKVYQDRMAHKNSVNLQDCLGTIAKEGVFFSSEQLNNQEKVMQFARVARFGYAKMRKEEGALRCTFCQLGMIDREAAAISNQQFCVVKLNRAKAGLVTFGYLFLPTEPLCYTPIHERIISPSLHDLEFLSYAISYEGLLTYAYWLSEQIEKVISTFSYAVTGEDELRMHFTDYILQTRSNQLHTAKLKSIAILQRKEQFLASLEGKVLDENSIRKLVALEKELISVRKELKNFLDSIFTQLQSVRLAIESIAVVNPKLENLYYGIILLKGVMRLWGGPFQKWAQKSLLQAMLDSQLGVITLFNGGQNDSTRFFSFALRYALLMLFKSDNLSDMVEIALNWYEQVRRLRRYHLERGDFPPSDRMLKLIYDLQKIVFQVLQAIQKTSFVSYEGILNTELLTLLPSFVKNKQGADCQFLVIDPQTCDAVNFYEKNK